MAAALLYVALLAAIAARQGAWGVSEQNCYHLFTIQWWGDPQMREPPGGVLRMCQFWSPVTLLWGGAQGAQGVFQLPSAACPPSFGGPYNDTFQELQAVSDDASFATAGFAWAPPCAPGSYWLTSQALGACEAGVVLQVDVVEGQPLYPDQSCEAAAQAPAADAAPAPAAEAQAPRNTS